MVPAEATDSQDCGEHGIRLCGTAMWKMHCTDMLPDSVPRAAVNSGLSTCRSFPVATADFFILAT